MTTATPPLEQPSNLMAIVLAYKNREVDWPTTKEALVNFTYAPEQPTPKVNDPGYAEWYASDHGFQPNTLGELTAASYTGKLEPDRFDEVANALWAKYPRKPKG